MNSIFRKYYASLTLRDRGNRYSERKVFTRRDKAQRFHLNHVSTNYIETHIFTGFFLQFTVFRPFKPLHLMLSRCLRLTAMAIYSYFSKAISCAV